MLKLQAVRAYEKTQRKWFINKKQDIGRSMNNSYQTVKIKVQVRDGQKGFQSFLPVLGSTALEQDHLEHLQGRARG